jgi:hypothetical protein
MRAAGVTFDEIAKQVGYKSRSGAKEAYDRALKLYGQEAVADLRFLEGERLEQLWRRVFARIIAEPDMTTAEMTSLVNAAVKVSARKASLFGLDAPRQVEVAGAGGGPLVTDVGQLLLERLEQLEQADVG